MLVISRRVGEQVIVGDDIRIVVAQVKNGRIRLAIAAPRETVILRGELLDLAAAKTTALRSCARTPQKKPSPDGGPDA